MITVGADVLAPGELLERFCTGRADVGAVVSFTGVCRAEPGVRALELEAYPGFTEREIHRHAEAARRRFQLSGLRVAHRTGRIAPGETIVFVATAAVHRRAAFEAADHLMDYLKSRAPFWKKEIADAGERWLEPRAQDYEDAARWEASEAVEERA